MPKSLSKVNFASARGPDFKIGDGQWDRLGAAYGRSLIDEQGNSLRPRISELTQEYLMEAAYEHSAGSCADASAVIKKLKKAFAAAEGAVGQLKAIGHSDLERHVKQLIGRHSELPFVNGRNAVDHVAIELCRQSRVLSAIVHACDTAAREFQGDELGFREGDAWNGWVRALAYVLRAAKLPVTRRKDVETGASPFVALIRALQECVPADCRRSTQSASSLSKAVSDALRNTRSPALPMSGREELAASFLAPVAGQYDLTAEFINPLE